MEGLSLMCHSQPFSHGIELAHIREHIRRQLCGTLPLYLYTGRMSMAPPFHANDDETRYPPDDAIAMLEADHHTIRCLFQHYEETDDQDLQRRIAADVFAALER